MSDAKLTLTKLLDNQSNEQIELLQDFSATLLQIPGQKYTIGSFYEGKKEDEEFIFFGYSFEKEQDFQINVDENGSFWICRESKQYGFSVNGIPVNGKNAHKLVFGDTIEIPFANPETEIRKKEGFFRRLFRKKRETTCPYTAILNFKEREFKCRSGEVFKTIHLPEETEDLKPENDADFLIGSNELIVKAILANLPFHFLPNLRLVSHLWNRVASPLVSRNCPTFLCSPSYTTVHIGGGYMSTEPYHNKYDGDDGTIFFRYQKELQNFASEKLVFSSSAFENITSSFLDIDGNFSNTLAKRWHKYDNDLRNFLPSLHGRIKHLVISETQGSSWREVHILNKVFKVLSPGLESLQLSDQVFQHSLIEFSKDWDFHDVKIFKINLRFSKNDYSVGTEKWAEEVVGKLGTKLENYEGIGGPFFHKIMLREFPKLSSVSLINVGASELIFLKELQNPLKTLCLFGVKHDHSYLWLLSDVLERHSQTLKTLVLFVISESDLLFPSFQKLEDFTFVCGKSVKLSLEVHYFSQFPVLKRLTLDWTERLSVFEYLRRDDSFSRRYELFSQSNVLDRWNENSHVFNSFFPSNSGQVCETLESLTIYHLSPNVELDYFEEDLFRRVGKIRKMFPNCDQDWIKRKGMIQFG